MKMEIGKQCCQALVLLQLLLLCVVSANYCTTTSQLSDTRLFTTVGEKAIYYFEDYIQGYNLEYDIDLSGADSTTKSTFKVYQGVDKMNQDDEFDSYPIVVDLDHLFDDSEEQEAYFAELATNIEGQYTVRFGEGSKTISPTLSSEIALPTNKNMVCFGVVILQSDKAIVDCAVKNPAIFGEWVNYFWIVSADKRYTSIETNSIYSEARPFARKTIKYDSSHNGIHQVYIVSGILFDQIENDDLQQEYLNIYRFIDADEKNSSGDIVLGKLVVSAPITRTQLDFSSDLRIADFGTIGDWIYLLDNNQGVRFFKYLANKITFLEKPLTNSLKRWGISLTLFGNTYRMTIAESRYLREYNLNFIDSAPSLLRSYQIEYENVGSVQLQCNTDHIILQQGSYLTIYKRGVTSLNYMKTQILSANAFYLWYSNNVYVAHSETITNYILQKPYFKISPSATRDDLSITLSGKSYNFDSSTTCKLALISSVVAKKTQEAFYSNFPQSREWNLQSAAKTEIPLSIYWVGPNIRYIEDNGKNTCSTSTTAVKSVSDEGDDLVIYINQAQELEVELVAGDSKQWVFSKIYPITNYAEGYFYILNQDSSNNLKIFICKADSDILDQLDCGEPWTTVKLGSRIVAMSIGKWGQHDNIMAVVLQDNQSFVDFYYLLDLESDYQIGQFWFRENLDSVLTGYSNTIIDLQLYENTLYSILEGKSSRFVSISSNINGVEHLEYITLDDVAKWPYKTDYWIPDEIVVNEHHPNIIFVKAPRMVYVIDVSNNTPRLLSNIQLSNAINQELIVTENNLIVAQSAEKITDYSMQNLLYLSTRDEFQYQVYDYDFVSPFLIAHGPVTGMIYIVATKAKTSDLKLLIFQAGTESLRTLVKVLDIESNVTIDTKYTALISAGGTDVDYIFLTYNGKSRFFRSPSVESIILVPLKFANHNVYVDIVQIQLLMCAWSGSSKQIEHDVTLVNGQTNIIVDQDYINKQITDLYADKQEHAEFQANVKNWYYGSVVQMSLACQQSPSVCGDQIKLTNIVSKNEEVQLAHANYIYDIQNYDGVLVYLSYDPDNVREILGYFEDDGTKQKVYNYIDINNGEAECEFFVPQYDLDSTKLKSVMIICFDYMVNYYYIQSVYDIEDDSTTTKDTKKYYLCEVDQDEGVIQRDQYQYFHGGLFVNQIGGNNPGIYIYNTTYSYTMSDNKDLTCAGLVHRISSASFGLTVKAPNFNPTSFFVAYQQKNQIQAIQKYAKLFITDSPVDSDPSERRIWFMPLDMTKSFNPQTGISSIDWIVYEDWVANHDLFVNDDTQIKKIKFVDMLEYSTTQKDNVIYRVIVMTDNTAMYEMALEFTLSNSNELAISAFSTSNSEIINVYNNYGSAEMFPNIEVYENTLSVAYLNRETYDVTVALYQLNTETESLLLSRRQSSDDQNSNRRILADDSHVPLHTMQGGYIFDMTTAFFDESFPMLSFALYKNSTNQGASLVTTDFSETLSLIALDFTPHVVTLETFGKFEDQTVDIHLLSDYSLYKNSFSLKVSYGSKSEPGGGLAGWAIALIVIASVLVLAGAAFFIWKWKFAGPSDNTAFKYVKQEESDAGYSLQEPIKA